MQREKMLEARQLISEKRYAEARRVLEAIDHPTARQWLQKLDEIESRPTASKPALRPSAPNDNQATNDKSAEKAGSNSTKLILALVASLLAIGLGAFIVLSQL